MTRSFIHLRRMLFGTSCLIVFGFAAADAFASGPTDPFGAACVEGWEPSQSCVAECDSAGGRVFCMNDQCLCAI